MGGLRKFTKVWSQDVLTHGWNWNKALPEYKSSMSLLHQPVCWHVWRTVYHNLCFILFAKSEVFWPFILSFYTYIIAFVYAWVIHTEPHPLFLHDFLLHWAQVLVLHTTHYILTFPLHYCASSNVFTCQLYY